MEQNEEQRKGAAEKARRIYKDTHSCPRVSEITDQPHFAVLVNESLRYDNGYGDDRSGPDYSTLEHMTYISFGSNEALEAWILENHLKKAYKVISVKTVAVEMKTTITVRE